MAKEKSAGLLRSGLIVGIMTMLSRILGMVRDVMVAALLGAGGTSDAFFVAFRIPNLMRRLFAEGAFNQAFVPVLSEYATRGDHRETRDLLNAVAGSLAIVLAIVTALGMLFSSELVYIFAPGFRERPDQFLLTTQLLEIMFPYLLLISLAAYAGSILNSWGRFSIPALTPIFLNFTMIIAVKVAPWFPAPAKILAWGVLVAGFVQLGFQLPFIARLRLLPLPKPNFRHPGVKRILKLMGPALFGVSVAQINLMINTMLASMLTAGSVTWLYYSDRMTELPLGVFGVAIGTVILPALSRRHASQDRDHFARMLDWGIRMVLLVSAPAAVAIFVITQPLLITLFKYGRITVHDVEMTAQCLQVMSVGIIAFMLIKVLAPGFYARQNTRMPVKIGMIAMASNMVFNLLLYKHLAHVGLAMSTMLSACLNASLLGWALYREKVLIFQPGWGRFMLRLCTGCALLGAGLYFFTPDRQLWLEWSIYRRALFMSGEVTIAIVGYMIWLFLTGMRLRDFRMQG